MLRNKELRQAAAIFCALSACLTAAGFAVHPAAGWMALLCAAVLGTVFFCFTRKRYRRIARLSEQIDLVLHNSDRLFIEDAEEGELSILQSEITKMTLRIRQQNESLKREKEHLADSLADIAHQLRTPLTSVNIILSLLADEPKKRARGDLLREAEGLLSRMDYLLTALLKLSRLDAGIVVFQPERAGVGRLVQAALRPLQIPMELRGITVRTAVPEGVSITCDAGWLAEALQNILKNCMESAGENGVIEVTCTDTPLSTELHIRDSGAGFSAEDLPNLFERFYRGKNTGTAGCGIGLALCRTIITRQGGTVTARNHPEGGALFLIRFPKEL